MHLDQMPPWQKEEHLAREEQKKRQQVEIQVKDYNFSRY
jgi:hypothetical protein